MQSKSEIFYHSIGNIFDIFGSAIHTSNDLQFFESKEIDVLVKFVGNHLPSDIISEKSRKDFLQLCNVLEIDADDLEICGVDVEAPTAPDIFKIIYMHYHQIFLIPYTYRLMHHVLVDMKTDIDFSEQDKTWLKLFLENQRIDTPANWVNLL